MKANIIIILLFISSYNYGQYEEYKYKRELIGVTDQWHKLSLPNDVFCKVLPSLNDIRIFGITPNSDTIEAPYILQLSEDKLLDKYVDFGTLLNTSYSKKGYYYSFKTYQKETINQVDLHFKQLNFDWKVKLEGSQDNSEWFTIIENYRIVGIKTDLTNFSFTKVCFPNSQYYYFRLFIESKEKPGLTYSKLSLKEVTRGETRTFNVKEFEENINKKTKQTEIDISLSIPVPVSIIKIEVNDTFDYYRPITIKYLTDSFITDHGWKYNYSTLASGTLNSLEENVFYFKSTILKKLKIVIFNYDNQALSIDTVLVKGYTHQLIARFTEPANYFLAYGNNNSQAPNYDITKFTDKIPLELTSLELGAEQAIYKAELDEISPLFKNKIWMWGILTFIILILGWFSIKMIKTK